MCTHEFEVKLTVHTGQVTAFYGKFKSTIFIKFQKKINITLRRSFVFMSINRLDFKTNKDKFQGEIENIFFGFSI